MGGGGSGSGGGSDDGKSKKACRCCAREGLRRGAWSGQEDRILTSYINTHGEGKWRELPQKAGLRRCGRSCRLRWLNYLRPDIKRGNISSDEEDLIIRLHKLLGNRWSLIAGRLPGRTDNEIKNYWNTNLCRKLQGKITKKQRKRYKNKKLKGISSEEPTKLKLDKNPHSIQARRSPECNKASPQEREENHIDSNNLVHVSDGEKSIRRTYDHSLDFLVDPDISELCISDFINLDFLQVHCDEIQVANDATGGDDGRTNNNSSCCLGHPLPTTKIIENCTDDKKDMLEDGIGYDNDNVQLDSTWEFSRLCSFLGIDENEHERTESL